MFFPYKMLLEGEILKPPRTGGLGVSVSRSDICIGGSNWKIFVQVCFVGVSQNRCVFRS